MEQIISCLTLGMERFIAPGTQCWNFITIYGARIRVGTELPYRPASLCGTAYRYDNPIPTWFVAPIDCSKIPAQQVQIGSIFSTKSYFFSRPEC